jgi:hypothetical protein
MIPLPDRPAFRALGLWLLLQGRQWASEAERLALRDQPPLSLRGKTGPDIVDDFHHPSRNDIP